ncbi:MAG: hypothetical protein HY332_11430 [Chloroflexi bacterium]|nr:hypothetical protein [Chloroflexota bacterium]
MASLFLQEYTNCCIRQQTAPDGTPIADDFGRDDPCESIVSGRHAREVLGFVPQHRWEMHYVLDEAPSSSGAGKTAPPAREAVAAAAVAGRS